MRYDNPTGVSFYLQKPVSLADQLFQIQLKEAEAELKEDSDSGDAAK